MTNKLLLWIANNKFAKRKKANRSREKENKNNKWGYLGRFLRINRRFVNPILRIIRKITRLFMGVVRSLIRIPLVFIKRHMKIENIKILSVAYYSANISNINRFIMMDILSSDSDNEQIDSYVIREKEEGAVCIPQHLSVNDGELVDVVVPELKIHKFYDCTVVGQTHIVTNYRFIFTEDYNTDSRVDLSYGDLLCCLSNGRVIVAQREISRHIDRGISLLAPGNYNYYHLMIETMSRLTLIDECAEYRHYPILVDSLIRTNTNFLEILNRCNIYKHPIIWVDKNEHVKVKELITASSCVFMPGNIKHRDDITVNDFVISSWLLNKHKQRLTTSSGGTSNFTDAKYIVSRRNTENSRLVNEREVVEVYKKFGYEVIYPEKLSLTQQEELFSNAKDIVATSGAAMANIIFCRPETRITIIIPDEHKFYLYSTMGYCLQLKMYAINAGIEKKDHYPGLDIFKVNINDIMTNVL